MTTCQITCTIGTTDPTANLGLEIWLDDSLIFNFDHVDREIPVTYKILEDDSNHKLKFVMKGKAADYTQLDDHGLIISDALLTIKDLAFDEIELGQLLIDHAVYTHDFNGTNKVINTKFYGSMGCNGTVSLEFTTPSYLWLLENM